MRRRTALRLFGAGGLLLVSGCSDVLAGPPPYLQSVSVSNEDDVRHETDFGLGPSQPREHGDADDPTKRLSCTWSGRGPFTVRCEMDDERAETVRLDASDNTEEGTADGGTITFRADDEDGLVGVGLVEDDAPVSDACRRSPSPD